MLILQLTCRGASFRPRAFWTRFACQTLTVCNGCHPANPSPSLPSCTAASLCPSTRNVLMTPPPKPRPETRTPKPRNSIHKPGKKCSVCKWRTLRVSDVCVEVMWFFVCASDVPAYKIDSIFSWGIPNLEMAFEELSAFDPAWLDVGKDSFLQLKTHTEAPTRTFLHVSLIYIYIYICTYLFLQIYIYTIYIYYIPWKKPWTLNPAVGEDTFIRLHDMWYQGAY